MIAFIRPPEETARPSRLRHVHRLLAATLLPTRSEGADSAPPVDAWKAWLFIGWLAVVSLGSIGYAVGTLW
jgi:hypothetical protein